MNRHITDKIPYMVVSAPNKNLVRNKNNWQTNSFLRNKWFFFFKFMMKEHF